MFGPIALSIHTIWGADISPPHGFNAQPESQKDPQIIFPGLNSYTVNMASTLC